jgi:predicted permease
MLDRLLHDVRYALRQTKRTPGFACAVVAMLALAIGANTALFSLVNALLLRTLPVRDPQQLVILQATDDRGQRNRPLYYATYAELAKLPVFDGVALYSGGGLFQIEARGAQNEGLLEASTPGLFEMLGLQPYLGRFFTTGDAPTDGPGAPVVVLSFDFWRRAFGADPKAMGETILIAGTPAVVIGVTPPGYKGLYVDSGLGFSVPLTFLVRQMGTDATRPLRGLNAVARLSRNTSLGRARAAVDTAWSALRVDALPAGLTPSEQKEISTEKLKTESLATGMSGLRREYQDPLLVLFGLTALLLTIACANLSGLLLARTAARERYLATCFALGASRWRIIQQVLVESLSLSLTGATIALPLAWWTTQLAAAVLWEGSTPLSQTLTPDGPVLALMAASAVATGLVMGVLPAISAGRRWAHDTLRSGGTVGRMSGRWGKALLVAQVAVSLVLLVGAGLFAETLRQLRQLDAGVRTDGLRWSRLFAVPNGYRNQNDGVYYPELARRLSEIPGVHSVALTSLFPTYFGFGNLVSKQPLARTDATNPSEVADGIMENVTPRFFETVGIPLLGGRDFSWNDDTQHPPVAIVNESVSRKLFPVGDAIGRRIRIGADPKRSAVEIVGIVRDASMGSYRLPHMPVVFRPRMQELQLARAPVLVYRLSGDPAVVDGALQKVIAGLGHEYPRRFYALEEQIDVSLLQERLLAGLSAFFASLAVLIAFVGLYGALAYDVTQRTREIAVRMALGALRGGVLRMVVADSMLVTGVGVAVGIPCALGAGGLVSSLIFGVRPSDPTILFGAAGFFIVMGAIAGLRPALRASSVEPMTALRQE